MGIDCQILLDVTKTGYYKSGDQVKGTLKFRLNKRKKFECIYLLLKGKGKCRWSETDSDDTSTWYTGKEEYVSKFIPIVKTTGYIEAGEHKYPFVFVLPDPLPSTFKDSTGKITYRIKAEFKKPGLFEWDKDFEIEIPVHGILEPCSPQPLIFGLQKQPFSLTSDNEIDMKMEIEKTLISPGESIHLKCCVNNKTDIPINGFKTKLISETIYYTTSGKSKSVNKTTVKESVVILPGVKKNRGSKFSYVVPTLPSLYSIQHSKILVREYKLKVTAFLPFPHRDASVEIPVVIGVGRKS